MGALYHILPKAREEEIEVRKFTDAQGWDEQKLRDHLPEDYVIFIIKKLPPSRVDKTVWMSKASGNFFVRSAWEYIRQKDQEEDIFTHMWSKKLPFEQSFLICRMWKFRVPVDEVVQSMGINLVSRYWCYIQPKSETMPHLFLTYYTTAKLWRLFANVAGISLEGLQLSQVVIKWWTSDCCPILKPLMRAVPTVIIWNIWKRRNSLKHGRPSFYNNLVFRVNSDLWKLGRTIYPNLQDLPTRWSDIVACLEKHKPMLYYLPVCWKPPEGILKCNTDGASRGNQGKSSYSFCIRNSVGDLVYAQGEEIKEGTDLEAEAVTIREALAHCVTEGVMQVCLETEVLIKILTRIWEVPWSIAVIIEDI